MHLLHYVHWYHWLLGAPIIPATHLLLPQPALPLVEPAHGAASSWRFSPPIASSAVAKWIHDNSWWIGVENLTFSQAESERMNGLATHLYFSTAGLRLKTYTEAEVTQALDALNAPAPAAAAAAGPRPMSISFSAKPGGAIPTTRPRRSTS